MNSPRIVSVDDLERETGLSKDLLRKWRSRYGFPVPLGGAAGEGGYARDQVVQLRLIKRLQGAGFRPGQVVGKSRAELEQLLSVAAAGEPAADLPAPLQAALECLAAFDLAGLGAWLQAERARLGLGAFVVQVLAPLIDAMGQAWARGELEIYHEHACSALLVRLLQAEIAATQPPAGAPRVLFATPSDELHGLGLLMAQAVLADAGAACIDLGLQVPLPELLQAAPAARADILAVSLSFAYPQWRVRPLLTQLRAELPLGIELWVGGAGAACIRRVPPGVRVFSDLPAAASQLRRFAVPAATVPARQG